MSALYHNLSAIYEGMYQTFINYDEEFSFYGEILRKYKCNSVVEAGCGTGRLARKFIANGFEYIGFDLSEDMLRIATTNYPNAHFLKADMRDFKLSKPVHSCIITGRSVSYLVADQDVASAFKCIEENLVEPAIFCFDFIDASLFIPSIRGGKTVTHEAIVDSKRYKRESFWKPTSDATGCFDWHSVFYEEKPEAKWNRIGEDRSVIRSFPQSEMIAFVEEAGFLVEKIQPKKSYAFDTLVIVARKRLT